MRDEFTIQAMSQMISSIGFLETRRQRAFKKRKTRFLSIFK